MYLGSGAGTLYVRDHRGGGLLPECATIGGGMLQSDCSNVGHLKLMDVYVDFFCHTFWRVFISL